MDRGLLSQPEVVEASRKFVCVRLATYEDADEAVFLKSLFVGRSGAVENTTFTMFSPGGREQLMRAQRSATHAFRDSRQMAEAMEKISARYPPRDDAQETSTLPLVANVRLAVDVAAADNLPLAVLFAKDGAALERLERTVAALAWSGAFVGKFTYVVARRESELSMIDGTLREGLNVIEPDRFGQKGALVARASLNAEAEKLTAALKAGLNQHVRVEKVGGRHVREGQLRGEFWETAVPVTDPMEREARERTRRQMQGR